MKGVPIAVGLNVIIHILSQAGGMFLTDGAGLSELIVIRIVSNITPCVLMTGNYE